MTDDTPYARYRAMGTAWRQTPLSDIVSARWVGRLKAGGYLTAGDVLDASPEVLADSVWGMGPVRAAKLRQQVLDAAVKAAADSSGLTALRSAQYEVRPVPAPTPDRYETLLSCLGVLAIFAILAVAWVMLP